MDLSPVVVPSVPEPEALTSYFTVTGELGNSVRVAGCFISLDGMTPIRTCTYWDRQLKSVKGCRSNIGLLLRML